MRLFATATSALILIVGFGSATLKADILGVTVPVIFNNFGASVFNLGFEFLANTNVTVTALGNMDFGSPSSLSQPQQVGLWDSSGDLLASAFVTSSSTQIDNFAFTFITPVALFSGNYYIVGGQGGAAFSGNEPVNVAPQITYVEDLYTYIGTSVNTPLYEPLTSESLTSTTNAGWFGGDVLLGATTTPEPSYYLVLGAAITALLVKFLASQKSNA
jgi:hypothetical protein